MTTPQSSLSKGRTQGKGRKFQNRAAKKAKRATNHQLRADTNAARANDVRKNPAWHGFDSNGNYRA